MGIQLEMGAGRMIVLVLTSMIIVESACSLKVTVPAVTDVRPRSIALARRDFPAALADGCFALLSSMIGSDGESIPQICRQKQLAF